jgi:general secretion pathway protein E
MPAALTTEFLCDLLLRERLLTEDQKRTILVKEGTQRGRVLQGKKGGILRRRDARYEVSPTEVIASFSLPVPGRPGELLDEDRLAEILARSAGVPYKKLDPLKLDMKLITATLSRPFARRHAVLPVSREDGTLTVAVANPFDLETLESIRRITGCVVKPVVSAKADILRIITEVYGFRSSVNAAEQDFKLGVDLGNLEQFVRLKAVDELEATDKHVVNAVEYLLHYALDQRASDIHFEPKREQAFVRLRIDGVLHNIHAIPKVVHPAMVSRLKTLARLDIAEKRKPQDGRIKTEQKGKEVELRVSTMPVAFGEKVVIRIFDPDVLMQDVGQLGFFEKELALFESFISNPHGLLLVTGPTGSGKTTTLYSALKVLATPEVNVVSIEDPIEMVYEQFNQVAIQPKAGITFGSALRTILRQDPDIIMVGEIRDHDTAEHCVQAALTGHLVLSTLHTNDAPSAVSRLLELGVEPFLLSSTLIGCVAQRLLRKICTSCKRETTLTPEELAVLGIHIPEGKPRELKVKFGEGCVNCRNTGLFGRSGVFEILEVTDKIRRLINQRRDSAEILRVARQDGMKTLREQAVRKLAQGATSFQEVLRVTGDLGG